MIQETSDSEENPRKRVFCPLPSYTGHTFLLEMPSLLPGGRACRVRGLSSQGHINSAPRELVPGQRPLRLPIFSHLWKRSLPASSKLSSCQESEGNSHFLRSSSTRESTLGRRTRSREKGYRRGQGVLALLSWWHRLEPQRRPPPPIRAARVPGLPARGTQWRARACHSHTHTSTTPLGRSAPRQPPGACGGAVVGD